MRPASEEAPSRHCIATRTVRPKDRLLRFVVGPDGGIVPDLAEKLPGRGLWVSAEAEALSRAVAGNLFPRAARVSVRVPPDLVERVTRLLAARCVDWLSLARRSGAAVCGFEKVAARVAEERAGLLLTAADAARDGRERADRLLRVTPVARVRVLTRAELGGAFGREDVVHAAVDRGRFGQRLEREAGRLCGFRNPDGRPGEDSGDSNG